MGGKRFWTGGYRQSGGVKPWTDMWKWIGDNSTFNYTDLSQGGALPSGVHEGKEELNIEAVTKPVAFVWNGDGSINDRNGEDKLPFVCQIRYDIIMKRFGVTSDKLR